VKILALFILISAFLYGETTLKIATYNVENLFDLKRDGHEYKEYIPYTKANWNRRTYNIKLNNIARVIKEINADIIALQEIESLQALKDLRFTLKQKGLYYQYYAIAQYKNTNIKVALLSKVPFVATHEVAVTSSYRYRNILETKFKIQNQEFYILVNHWKSKAGPESQRIVSAKKLMKRVKEIGEDKNIILLGDFNSDYEEYKVFKRKRKHNDTDGITGINHILKSINYTDSAKQTHLEKGDFYNLLYDADKENRWTYIFRGKKGNLDNILVSSSLLEKGGITYKYNSVDTYNPPYLFKGKYIYRWQVSRAKVRRHKAKGYSDHLALTAEFLVH